MDSDKTDAGWNISQQAPLHINNYPIYFNIQEKVGGVSNGTPHYQKVFAHSWCILFKRQRNDSGCSSNTYVFHLQHYARY